MTEDRTTEMIIRRLDNLEKWREEDREAAKLDRHTLRGEFTHVLAANTIVAAALQRQVTEIDKASGGAGDAAKIAWMQWVIGAGAALLVLALGYIFRK